MGINKFWKKTFDILLALVLLPILLPILIIIGILIKIDSKGAVFFSQKRLGQHNTYFQCIKFQTMYDNNDDLAHSSFPTDTIAHSNPNCKECHLNFNSMFPRKEKSFKIVNCQAK